MRSAPRASAHRRCTLARRSARVSSALLATWMRATRIQDSSVVCQQTSTHRQLSQVDKFGMCMLCCEDHDSVRSPAEQPLYEFPIERGKIREFALATQSSNSEYFGGCPVVPP